MRILSALSTSETVTCRKIISCFLPQISRSQLWSSTSMSSTSKNIRWRFSVKECTFQAKLVNLTVTTVFEFHRHNYHYCAKSMCNDRCVSVCIRYEWLQQNNNLHLSYSTHPLLGSCRHLLPHWLRASFFPMTYLARCSLADETAFFEPVKLQPKSLCAIRLVEIIGIQQSPPSDLMFMNIYLR